MSTRISIPTDLVVSCLTGSVVDIPINIDNLDEDSDNGIVGGCGGSDLCIHYDPSIFSFISAVPGDILPSNWAVDNANWPDGSLHLAVIGGDVMTETATGKLCVFSLQVKYDVLTNTQSKIYLQRNLVSHGGASTQVYDANSTQYVLKPLPKNFPQENSINGIVTLV